MGGYISSPQVLTRKVSGPYHVGCKDLMIDGTVLGDRGLFMRIYFPTDTEDANISQFPLWLPRPQYAHGLGEYLGQSPQKMNLITSLIVGEKREDCIENSQLSTKKDKWPIVVFSHGLGGSRTFYSTYCTSLASHGYVVAAVEHRDQSACWTYQLTEKNGELVEQPIKIKIIEKNEKNEFKIRNQQVGKRVSECVKALNVLEQMNLGTVPEKILIGSEYNWAQFKDKLIISTASVIGHSFGGATSLASSAYTTDFQKAIVLDGWTLPLDSTHQEQAKQPTMFLNVGDWQWAENLDVMRKVLPNNDGNLLLTLDGAVHQCFSDFPFIFPHWLAKKFGVQGRTESSLCMQAAIELSLEFLANGKEGAQKLKDDKFSKFVSDEIYGREKFKAQA
uniref:1-alkyl-2-acetylglycerophosphocholine esterase n=1 Tax=Caenorhabditis japonica TaxID=281687 RepID=A0A8R1DE88_CAEJA